MGLSDAQGAYLATGDPETEENTTLLYPGELGRVIDFDRGTAGAPNRCRYQQVRCAAGITPVKGQVLYWNDKSKFEVTTAAANRAQVAGIFGTQRDASAAQKYIWIGKKGRLGVLFQGAPTSAPDALGKPVVPSTATAGVADCLLLATAPPIGLIGGSLSVTTANIATVNVQLAEEA